MTATTTTRSVHLTTEIAAPADAVWAALTQADLIARWFSPTAEGEGDTIRFSWGPDMAWDERLVEVAKGEHLCWGDPESPTVVDWHLETKGGHTVVRLVQSGFKAGAEWDEGYEATQAGWRYFLFNLKHYLTRHRGTPRVVAFTRRSTQLARPIVWDRLVGRVKTDEVMRGAVIQNEQAPRAFTATVPDLNEALLFIELGSKNLGVYLSTYGLPSDRVQALQRWVDELSLLAT